jgi:hypothetical protein
LVEARPAKSSPAKMRSRSLLKLLAHGFIVVQLIGLHQDVPHVNLIDDDLGLAAAPLVELDDVKTARRAHRRR